MNLKPGDNPGRKTSAPTLINIKVSGLESPLELELGYSAAKYYSRGWRSVVEKQEVKIKTVKFARTFIKILSSSESNWNL